KPHKRFQAEVYVLTKEEGGRHTPFFQGYRPQFYFRTTDVTGVCTLPAGGEMVMPGDNVGMAVELITPIAMGKELRLAIRAGGRRGGGGGGVGRGGGGERGGRGVELIRGRGMEKGLGFARGGGGRTVGAGVVTDIAE